MLVSQVRGRRNTAVCPRNFALLPSWLELERVQLYASPQSHVSAVRRLHIAVRGSRLDVGELSNRRVLEVEAS